MSLGKWVKQFVPTIVAVLAQICGSAAYAVVGNKTSSEEYDSAPPPLAKMVMKGTHRIARLRK